jgi:hypothetical protein
MSRCRLQLTWVLLYMAHLLAIVDGRQRLRRVMISRQQMAGFGSLALPPLGPPSHLPRLQQRRAVQGSPDSNIIATPVLQLVPSPALTAPLRSTGNTIRLLCLDRSNRHKRHGYNGLYQIPLKLSSFGGLSTRLLRGGIRPARTASGRR